MKIYKVFALFLTSLLLLLPEKVVNACGPQVLFHGYSFLNLDIVNRESDYAPYYFYFDRFYNYFEKSQEAQTKTNLEEWQDRFCDQVNEKDLHAVIYTSRLSQLKSLKTAVYNKKYPVSPVWKTNTFAQHLKDNKCKETIDYLVFAKECEPHVVRPANVWNAPPRDRIMMQALIDDGRNAFRKTKSHYIRLRYAYQLIRLAHYRQDYEQAMELYDYLMPKIDPTESILYRWIQGHRAGVLMRLGKNVEASYEFSLIFANCPDKRESAFRSFNIKTDEEWEACLLMCKDNKERATLYALRATSDSSKAAEEMKKIYELDPQNPSLELLLVKEIRKLEKDRLGFEFNNQKRENKQFFDIPRKHADRYLVTLRETVSGIIADHKVARLDLWKLAEAYLLYLSGDAYAAKQAFGELGGNWENEALLEQLEVFRLALEINSIDKIDAAQEKRIAEIITKNELYKKYKDFPNFLNDRLAFVYARQGNPGKAFRCQYGIEQLQPSPQLDIIEDLLAVCRKEELTKFERALIFKQDGTTIESDLLDMKGTLFLAQGKPEAALEVFKRIPRNDWDIYQFNPFIDTIMDCIHCPLINDSLVFYNKVEIIERMFELEYKAKADFVDGPKFLYELGTAYYNMTYFGNAWQVADFYRSGSNWYYDKDRIFPEYYYPYGNLENQDCSLALEYFEKARSTTKDLELAARASFMAAKCEHNTYYVSKNFQATRGNNIPNIPDAYQRYFQLLKQNYSNTDFYEAAVAECKYFEAYVRK